MPGAGRLHDPHRWGSEAGLLAAGAATGVVLTVRSCGWAGLRRKAALAEAVAYLSHWALGADQPDELLRESLRVAVEVIGADYGTALRRLADGGLQVAQELGPEPLPAGTLLPLAPQRSYAQYVVQTGEPFVSADLRSDPRVAAPGPLLSRGVVSGLAVPVRGADDVLGVLALHSRSRRRYTQDDVAAAGALAGVVATAWQQAAQRERLGHQALHDPLTGLANRVLFVDRLEHALARRPTAPDSSAVAVMLIDLDDFKGVNDSYGHAAGDELLTLLAHRFQAMVRPQDTIARLGGDEFGLVCDEVPDEATAVALARRLQEACSQPAALAGSGQRVCASVGLTWSGRPSAPRTAAALLSEADLALYRAKDQGRGRLQVFDHGLQRSARRRRRLETELAEALDREEFRLHFQPVRRAGDLAVVGVEALLRWQHPSRGLLLPDEFVPTAERSGLLVPLGAWVLATACRQAAAWQRTRRTAAAPVWLAVNVSPRQLDDPRLPDTVRRVLRETGLVAQSLALELTESALLAGGDNHREALAQLRQTGAQLFLDDFGTGYSSLTHLTELPIQAVKIDKSFVAGLPGNRRNAAVVSSLITMSAELDLKVIAEGVETAEQLWALRRMHCQAVQGFLLDLPAEEPSLTRAQTGAQDGTYLQQYS